MADITVGIARQFSVGTDLMRDMRRAALLHDIGKLGVSNLILDKPGKPDDSEFAQIRSIPITRSRFCARSTPLRAWPKWPAASRTARWPGLSPAIARRADSLGDARAHRGRRVRGAYRARPYRRALSWSQAREIMFADAGAGFDHDCLHALDRWYDAVEMQSRVEQQLQAVERACGRAVTS